MAFKEFNNQGLFEDSEKNLKPPIGEEVSYYDLDSGTRDAILNDVKSFMSWSREKTLLTLEKTYFSISEPDDNENFSCSVFCVLSYDEGERLKRQHMNDSEKILEYLKDYNVKESSMDFIVSEVSRFNKKLSKVLDAIERKKGSVSWRDLNSVVIESILDIYNMAAVDFKTGKIIHL